MTVLNGTCFNFLCVFYPTPKGRRGEEKKISVNVNTAMQIKTFKSEVIQWYRMYLGVIVGT